MNTLASKRTITQPNLKLYKTSQKTKGGMILKTLLSFAVMGILVLIPPIAPLTAMGMDVLGVFIGTVLLLSLVDTTWPAILSIPLFSMTGIMTLNETIAASFGNWIIMFIIMSFVLTYALNKVGFTGRLTTFFMSRKSVQRSPWSLMVLSSMEASWL